MCTLFRPLDRHSNVILNTVEISNTRNVSEMGHMENAGSPRRVPFHRPDKTLVTHMAGTDGQLARPPCSMGNGAQPMGFHHKIPKRQRQSTSQHLVSPTDTDL